MSKLFCLLTLVLFGPPAAQGGPTTVPIDIQADRLEVNQKLGLIQFEGNVRVKRGSFELQCARMRARYRPDGSVLSLVAKERVRVRTKDFHARADTATFDQATGQLVLTGSPRLSQGPNRLTGARVVVWIDDERVVVEKAKGTLHPDIFKKKPTSR